MALKYLQALMLRFYFTDISYGHKKGLGCGGRGERARKAQPCHMPLTMLY